MKSIAMGSYLLAISCLVMGLLGVLGFLEFDIMASLLLYFVLKELSDFTASIFISNLEE
jgi:uncharacterized membrane-anchored protein YitT (DUF2179 family)